jgi:hypothetical protein
LINITNRAFSAGAIHDVKDIEVSYDGRRLIFAMRAPQIEGTDEKICQHGIFGNMISIQIA